MAVNQQSSQVFKGPPVPNGILNLNTNLTNIILVAKFDYESREQHELDLKKNERLILIDNSKNWWLVKKYDSDLTGYVPSNYVKKEKKSLLDKIIPRKLHATTTSTTTNPITTTKSFEEIKLKTYLSKAIVKHRYTAAKSDELTLNAGIEVKVLEKFVDGWWKIAASESQQQIKELIGLYPSNYLRELEINTSPPTTNNNNNNNNNMMTKTNSNNNMQNNQDSNPAKCESISSNEKEIEYVKVRYAHHAGPPNLNSDLNELNVSVDEILRIVEEENELISDNEKPWLKVFNCHGLIGLIPYSCVEPYLPILQENENFVFIRHPALLGLYAGHNWYFGNISRFDTILNFEKYAEVGDFLVRDSDNGTFSISLKADGSNVKHFKIILKENKLTIGKKVFQTMDDLLQHYHKNPIFDQNSEKLYLIKPFDPPLQKPDQTY